MHPSDDNAGSTQTTKLVMPRYQCHKQVWALKIAAINLNVHDKASTGATITPAEKGYAAFPVNAAYMDKHKPQVGGYYVVYDDGYKSFSPARAFEDGYAPIRSREGIAAQLHKDQAVARAALARTEERKTKLQDQIRETEKVEGLGQATKLSVGRDGKLHPDYDL